MSSAAITGTAAGGLVEADVQVGGKTIIITITDATWRSGLSTPNFNDIRQNIIDGITGDTAQAKGWNALVGPAIPVGNVVRTSNTVVTITLPAVAGYSIARREIVSVVVPHAALLTGTGPINATPTFPIAAPVGQSPMASIGPAAVFDLLLRE